jgi:RecA/RadA recombinase
MERRRRQPEPEKKISEQIKASASRKTPRKIDPGVLVPSGSTLLNCCCSDNPMGAYPVGKIITIPGPSQTGKSILELTVLAEAAMLKQFDEYELIYDDCEEAAEFDLSYLFNEEIVSRIVAPNYDGDDPVHSDTIQDLQDNVLSRCKDGKCKPFIYILDSLDALTSTEEIEREMHNALVRAKTDYDASKIKESYNTEKARIIGRILRLVKGNLKSSRSLLMIVQQERTAFNALPNAPQYTTSGGKAPFYYSAHQVRLTRIQQIKDKEIVIGNFVKAAVVKNKLTGKKRSCEFKIYEDYGVDDVASCVKFLCANWWPHPSSKQTGTWDAEELGIQGTQANLIKQIEDGGMEIEMKKVVGDAWNHREENLRLDRKRRF